MLVAAEVFRSEPLEIVKPAEEDNPAVVMPPVKDEVAAEVLLRAPPSIKPVVKLPVPLARIPPLKVELALSPRIVVVPVPPMLIWPGISKNLIDEEAVDDVALIVVKMGLAVWTRFIL